MGPNPESFDATPRRSRLPTFRPLLIIDYSSKARLGCGAKGVTHKKALVLRIVPMPGLPPETQGPLCLSCLTLDLALLRREVTFCKLLYSEGLKQSLTMVADQ